MKKKIAVTFMLLVLMSFFQFYRGFSVVSEKRSTLKKSTRKLAFKLASIRLLLLQRSACTNGLVVKKAAVLQKKCTIDYYGDYYAILAVLQQLSHSCRIGMLVSLQLLHHTPLFLHLIGKQDLCKK